MSRSFVGPHGCRHQPELLAANDDFVYLINWVLMVHLVEVKRHDLRVETPAGGRLMCSAE